MKVYRGTRRRVIVFKRIVVKLPISKTHIPWRVIKKIPLASFNEKFGWGIWENLQEFMTWIRLRSPFLVPIYMSMGLITIQKRAVGEPMDFDDFMKAIDRISTRTNRQTMELNPHNFDEDNWIKSKWGYQMIDSGGRSSGLNLRTFMVRWKNVLEEELKC